MYILNLTPITLHNNYLQNIVFLFTLNAVSYFFQIKNRRI